MTRRPSRRRTLEALTHDGLAQLTLADFRRLERALRRRPGYLDEELYWWLVDEMLKRLAAAES